MATNTLPTFSASSERAPWEPKYFIRYPFEGSDYCIGFDDLNEVLHAVTSKKDQYGKYLPTDVVNLVYDFAEESLEWNAAPPVAEAVADEPCGPESSPFWDWFASTLRIGAVVAPWVILLILGRVAWDKAVAWGWV